MLLCLRDPWIILLIESMDGLSGFLSLVAGNYYCSLAAPPGMLASLNGILAAAVFGAGYLHFCTNGWNILKRY